MISKPVVFEYPETVEQHRRLRKFIDRIEHLRSKQDRDAILRIMVEQAPLGPIIDSLLPLIDDVGSTDALKENSRALVDTIRGFQDVKDTDVLPEVLDALSKELNVNLLCVALFAVPNWTLQKRCADHLGLLGDTHAVRCLGIELSSAAAQHGNDLSGMILLDELKYAIVRAIGRITRMRIEEYSGSDDETEIVLERIRRWLADHEN
jgi:hypothetical protein